MARSHLVDNDVKTLMLMAKQCKLYLLICVEWQPILHICRWWCIVPLNINSCDVVHSIFGFNSLWSKGKDDKYKVQWMHHLGSLPSLATCLLNSSMEGYNTLQCGIPVVKLLPSGETRLSARFRLTAETKFLEVKAVSVRNNNWWPL